MPDDEFVPCPGTTQRGCYRAEACPDAGAQHRWLEWVGRQWRQDVGGRLPGRGEEPPVAGRVSSLDVQCWSVRRASALNVQCWPVRRELGRLGQPAKA